MERIVDAQARTLVQEHVKEVLKNLGNVNLGHVMGDWEVSEIDVRLCLVKSVVKLAAFVKKLLQTGLPAFKFLYELESLCSVKKLWSHAVPL
jgi:hypothetical protein